MKVEKLIEMLGEMDQDAEVVFEKPGEDDADEPTPGGTGA